MQGGGYQLEIDGWLWSLKRVLQEGLHGCQIPEPKFHSLGKL